MVLKDSKKSLSSHLESLKLFYKGGVSQAEKKENIWVSYQVKKHNKSLVLARK